MFLGDTKSLYKTSFLLAFGGSYNDYVTPLHSPTRWSSIPWCHTGTSSGVQVDLGNSTSWGWDPFLPLFYKVLKYIQTVVGWLFGISEPSTVPGLLKWFHNVHGWLGHEILVNFLEWPIFRCDYCHLFVLGRVSFDTIWLFPNISTWDQSQRSAHNMICLRWTKTLQQLRYAGMVKKLFVLEYVPLPYHLV